MKAKLTIAAALLMFSALPAAAQRVISAGMNPGQVRGTFGTPARTREEGEWTYWFYSNGCPNRCGSDDVVFFRNEQVVAAVLRGRARRISAPPAADAIAQAGGSAGSGAIRLNAAPANDGDGPGNDFSRRPPERIIVKGRSRDRDDDPDNDSEVVDQGPARVGGVSVEPGSAVAPPARSGSDAARSGQGTIIRGGAVVDGGEGGATRGLSRSPTGAQGTNGRTVTGSGPITAGGQPAVELTDSTQTARATNVDDTRSERESQVTRTTVPNQPDTIQARRRDRENSVTPRVVPRP